MAKKVFAILINISACAVIKILAENKDEAHDKAQQRIDENFVWESGDGGIECENESLFVDEVTLGNIEESKDDPKDHEDYEAEDATDQ